MSFDQSNIQPFLETVGLTATQIKQATDGDISNESDTSATSRSRTSPQRELIEKDGKTVSRTSTGKRKFHKKSKLGCDTCKRRRVKCDEGKPVCNKCKNMGIECTYHLIANIKTDEDSEETSTAAAILSAGQSFRANNGFKAPSPPSSVRQSRSRNRVSKRPKQKEATPPQQQQPLQAKSLLQDLMANKIDLSKFDLNKIDLSKIDHPLAALAQKFKNGLGGAGGPEFSFPSFNVKPPNQNSSPNLPSISTSLPQIDPTLSLRSSMVAHQINAKDVLDRNTLSLNMNDISNNPTISPQPSISLDSQASPLSANHRITGGDVHNSDQNDFAPNPSQYNTSMPSAFGSNTSLNLVDLRLMYHYTAVVAPTITTAGISEQKIWSEDIPQLAFSYPFLMHSILGFSATHLSRSISSLEQSVTYHRGEALRLLREAVLEISSENTDALVASALILIMDSLANASLPSSLSPTSLPASAWIFHVKGAATILTAVWPLPLSSRFYKFISVDLSDLGDIINEKNGSISELVCFDESIADLYPVEYDSPYLITLAYLDKLHHEKYKSDFILRIFAFPALLDKTFLALLMSGDLIAMRIMRSYYSLLRGFTTEMKDKVWFLEGVSKVLPVDVDDYSGGGGMHMMLDFLGGGLPSMTTTNLSMGLNIDINDHFMNP